MCTKAMDHFRAYQEARYPALQQGPSSACLGTCMYYKYQNPNEAGILPAGFWKTKVVLYNMQHATCCKQISWAF